MKKKLLENFSLKGKIFLILIISFFSVFLLLSIYFLLEINFDKNTVESVFNFSKSRVGFEKDISKFYYPQQKYTDIINYTLDVNLDMERENFIAEASIDIMLKEGFFLSSKDSILILNMGENLKINSLTLNNLRYNYLHNDDYLKIKLKNIKFERFNLKIKYIYSSSLVKFNPVHFRSHNNSKFVFTISEPIFASRWYPCNDTPSDKFFADVFIQNNSNYISVSNGKLVSVKTLKEKKIFHWKTEYPISSYLLSINSGEYYNINETYLSDSKDTIKLSYYCLKQNIKNAKTDFTDHKNIFPILEKLFGPYPFPEEKYAVIEIPWEFGAMENQTITAISSNFILGFHSSRDVLVHELAHHWWGNAVGIKSWKDIWLNEGFATYAEILFNEHFNGKKYLPKFLPTKKLVPAGRLYNPKGDLFSQLVYKKGAWVLHMLRKKVGDKAFFKILKVYYNKFKYKNASTFDFIKVCESISKLNLKNFFNQWVFNDTETPKIKLTWKSKKIAEHKFELLILTRQLNGRNKLSKDAANKLSKDVANKINPFEFDCEVKIVFKNKCEIKSIHINRQVNKFKFEINKKPDSLIIDPNNWLLVNFN